MSPEERQACYNARRVIRAADPAKFARKHGFDRDPLVMQLSAVLPAYLAVDCIAEAERKALDAVKNGSSAQCIPNGTGSI